MSVNSIDSDQYVDGSIDLAHMSADSVDSSQYVDASIDNAHLADDAVGVAELSATGTASSSTFLRGDNAWAAAGGGWTALASTTASNDASVAFTSSDGINHSTYFTYMIVGVRVKPATTGVNLYIALSDDNGASYEADAGDYAWGIHQVDQDGVSATNYSASSTVIQMVPTVQTNAGPGVYFTLIWNPIASATAGGNEIYWDLSGEENTSSDRYRATGFGGTLIAAGDSGGFDAIRFIMSSGNITSGEFSLYGLTKPFMVLLNPKK